MNGPAHDEIEIHVFGRGVGEAILVHLGDGCWIAVDSTEDRPGNPWAVTYLESVGVSPDHIETLVLTHWHADHIRGAAKILERSPDADVVISSAGKSEEFINFVPAYAGRGATAINAATNEMDRVLKHIKSRKITTGRANFHAATKRFLVKQREISSSGKLIPVQVWSLSPSELDTSAARKYFSDVRGKFDPDSPPAIPVPENHASVVLLVKIGVDQVLFGADREDHPDPERGWSVVIDSKNQVAMGGTASVFKIPHHGSATAYHANLWPSVIGRESINIITPFVGGRNPLPDQTMLDCYARHGENLYLAGRRSSSKDIQRAISASAAALSGRRITREEQVRQGSVRLRKRILSLDAPWEIKLFGDARKYP